MFIDALATTYPYADTGASGIHSKISFAYIKTQAQTAFNQIASVRRSRGGIVGRISFRYDWRLMLAVIRAYLPERDDLVGPTWDSMVQYGFGKTVANDPGFSFSTIIRCPFSF